MEDRDGRVLAQSEAAKLGFARCLLPEQNRARLEHPADLELVGVKSLRAALDLL